MIFGHTRYSVYSPDGGTWRAAKFLTEESYRNFLFSEERLKFRERIFIDLSLPIVLSNIESNDDYYHLVEYSSELPEEFKTRLLKACSVSDRIVPIMKGERNGAIQTIISSSGFPGDVIGLFKLDDDDLLSVDYIRNARKYVSSEFSNFVVSFPKGLTAWFDQSTGGYTVVKSVYQSKINIGLLQVVPVDVDSKGRRVAKFFNIGPHGSCDSRYPTILDASFPAFVWTRSGIQDTAIEKKGFVDRVYARVLKLDDAEDSEIESFPTLRPVIKS